MSFEYVEKTKHQMRTSLCLILISSFNLYILDYLLILFQPFFPIHVHVHVHVLVRLRWSGIAGGNLHVRSSVVYES